MSEERMKREDWLVCNPERTIACLAWKNIPEGWRNKYKEVRKWYVVTERIWKGSPDWEVAQPKEPQMKPYVYVNVHSILMAQQIFGALSCGYRWLCVPNSDLPLALVEEKDEPMRDNDLVVLVAPRVEVD